MSEGREEYWGQGIEQHPQNLNELAINDEHKPLPIAGRRGPVSSGAVTVVFDALIDRLCDEIERWPAVVGCMAWLTNEAVLYSLSTREAVSILLQKEDFLRPDGGGWSKSRLRGMYGRLKPGERRRFGADDYSVGGDPTLPPLLCCGVARTNVTPPRMHHKFLVFGTWDLRPEDTFDGDLVFVPKVVWTGSLNATENGARSLENAVLIRDEVIAKAYWREWETLLGLAEPLDWAHEWVAPLYRLGT